MAKEPPKGTLGPPANLVEFPKRCEWRPVISWRTSVPGQPHLQAQVEQRENNFVWAAFVASAPLGGGEADTLEEAQRAALRCFEQRTMVIRQLPGDNKPEGES